MVNRLLILVIAITLLGSVPARAQGVPLEELTSPQKKVSCSDLVTAQSAIDSAELAFTGRVVRRNEMQTWFRVYVVHKGEYRKRLLEAAGFPGGKHFVAGSGQSYEEGEVYTVAVRKPADKDEERFGADWINALDSCGESVLSKAHDRYGLYRVDPERLKRSKGDDVITHFYLRGAYYLAALAFAMLAGGWIFFQGVDNARALLLRLRSGEEDRAGQ